MSTSRRLKTLLKTPLTGKRVAAIGRRRFAALAVHAGLAASLSAFATTPSLAAPTMGDRAAAQVRMHDIAFLPQSLTVMAGTTITWTNDDEMVHTVTSGVDRDEGAWTSSSSIPPGGTFSVKLSRPGTYHYYCEPHMFSPSMHATIIVTAARP